MVNPNGISAFIPLMHPGILSVEQQSSTITLLLYNVWRFFGYILRIITIPQMFCSFCMIQMELWSVCYSIAENRSHESSDNPNWMPPSCLSIPKSMM